MASFSKLLSKTDTRKRLAVPTKFLKFLPSFGSSHAIDIGVLDDENGQIWTFRCSIRKKSRYLKPVFSNGWVKFASSKNLNVGDKITFITQEERHQGQATKTTDGGAKYKILVKKPVKTTGGGAECKILGKKPIKLFGVIVGYSP